MKFSMRKNVLLEALSKSNEVANKGIKTDFTMTGRVTIKCLKNDVSFCTSNGHLDMRLRIDKQTDDMLCDIEDGTCTIDASVARSIVKAIGGTNEDLVITVGKSNNSMTFEVSKSVKRR